MSYSISQANLEKDRSEIDSLWRKNFNSSIRKRFSWIYENNPSGPATCLLLKDKKKIVGATTLFPRRILINGKYHNAGIAGDFVMDEGHRVLGPALSLQRSAISNCDGERFNILYGFPNKKSELVLLRAGYKVLGEILSLTKPLKSYYYLKKHVDLPIITKMLAKAIDFFMEVLSKERYYKANKEYSVETPISFDQRFDTFWQKVSTQFPIIGERTSSYLNWRFMQTPHKRYQIFALSEEKSKDVLGYVVYSIAENKSYVDDLLCLDMGSVLDSLLSEYLLYQRKGGIDSVTIYCLGPQALVNKLKKLGFSVRGKKNKILIYAPTGSECLPYVFDVGMWYLFSGDNDV